MAVREERHRLAVDQGVADGQGARIWLASGRLLQRGDRDTAASSNGIPATPADAFVGRDQRWPIRKSQNARRAINRGLAIVFQL